MMRARSFSPVTGWVAIGAGFALALSLIAGCETTTLVNGQQVANPAPVEVDAKKRADVRLQLAARYYQGRQYQVALSEIRQALQSDPNLASAYGLMGLIYMDLDDRREAESSFARALQIEADNPEINNNYGWYLCRTGRERAAIEYFQRASSNRLYSTPALPMQNAGVCLLQIKDYAAAEPFLHRSFELDAGSAVVKFQLARLYLATGRLDRSRFYLGLLEKSVQPTAETLWLALRLARAEHDTRGERELGDDLRRRFPQSTEVSALNRGAFDD